VDPVNQCRLEAQKNQLLLPAPVVLRTHSLPYFLLGLILQCFLFTQISNQVHQKTHENYYYQRVLDANAKVDLKGNIFNLHPAKSSNQFGCCFKYITIHPWSCCANLDMTSHIKL